MCWSLGVRECVLVTVRGCHAEQLPGVVCVRLHPRHHVSLAPCRARLAQSTASPEDIEAASDVLAGELWPSVLGALEVRGQRSPTTRGSLTDRSRAASRLADARVTHRGRVWVPSI